MAEVNKNEVAAKDQPKRSLVPVTMGQGGVLRPSNLTEAIEVAKLMAHSGMVPKQYEGNPGAVLVAIQMGAELGLSPLSSIQNIAVINGRPSLWGDAVLALVVSDPRCEDVVESLDEKTMTATCMVKRVGRTPIERTFSMGDAKTAGLAGKQGPWSQYPKRMLQQRARGFALRDAFPDKLRGIISSEEAGDFVHIAAEPLDVTEQEPSRPPEGRSTFGKKAASPAETETYDPKTGEIVETTKPEEPASPKQMTAEEVMRERSALMNTKEAGF